MLIDSRLLTIRLRSEEDECRFYIYDEARHSVPGLYLLDKSEFSGISSMYNYCHLEMLSTTIHLWLG